MSSLSKGHGVAHVGLPKTGSTYLQKHYFSKLSRNFWSTQGPFSWPTELDFLRSGNTLWYRDLDSRGGYLSRTERGARYAHAIRPLSKVWCRAARSFAASTDSLDSWFLSAEGLCGLSTDTNALHMSILKEAGVARVLFVCRRQATWAQSLWRQFLLAEDRFARFVPFETLFGAGQREGVVDLDWSQYIQSMDAHFGADNVLVLPYELLKADSVGFFKRVNTFLCLAEDTLIPDRGVHENQSRTGSEYHGFSVDGSFPFVRLPWVRRKLHRVAARYPWLAPTFLKQVHSMSISNEALDALQHLVSAANKRLETRIGIDLGQYGYY